MYSKDSFFNRDLSWLEFNNRVLDEAEKDSNPLLEKIKFLAISSSNLDEFYMIRVSGIIAQLKENYEKADFSGISPSEQLEAIKNKVSSFIKTQDRVFSELKNELKKENIILTDYSKIPEEVKVEFRDYYKSFIFPVLTPLAIDASRPFPFLLNKSLNIVVRLSREGEDFFCIIQVPQILKRFKEFNKDGKKYLVQLEDIIRDNLGTLFEGYEVIESALFRLTRDAEMIIDEDEAEDLLIEIKNSLQQRKWGEPVRLELNKNTPMVLLDFLLETFDNPYLHLIEYSAPLELNFLFDLASLHGFEHLKYEKQEPIFYNNFNEEETIFKAIRKGDILLHHPFDSFDHVVKLVEEAATDKKVLAIKQTLYRVSGDSPIIKSLIKAANNGKQVTVLVELKARFDEERNIMWATSLEDAGCHVIYGLKGLKTHCKCLLIVRKESEGIRRYVHFGTGNYNDSTAKMYTDLSLLTCKEELCIDASNLFNKLSGFSCYSDWLKLGVAPEYLRDAFYDYIDNEIINAQRGKKAYITAKMNSLADQGMIEKLYEASKAGVKIKLIIRGICCLKPGVEGLSENIEVYSLVGRFLEHTRIFNFYNSGDNKVFLSSADWMTRNLNRRVEVLFPIEDINCRKEVINILDSALKDTVNLRKLSSEGTYTSIKSKENYNSHIELYKNSLKKKS